MKQLCTCHCFFFFSTSKNFLLLFLSPSPQVTLISSFLFLCLTLQSLFTCSSSTILLHHHLHSLLYGTNFLLQSQDITKMRCSLSFIFSLLPSQVIYNNLCSSFKLCHTNIHQIHTYKYTQNNMHTKFTIHHSMHITLGHNCIDWS